jgi:hypothetical protein
MERQKFLKVKERQSSERRWQRYEGKGMQVGLFRSPFDPASSTGGKNVLMKRGGSACAVAFVYHCKDTVLIGCMEREREKRRAKQGMSNGVRVYPWYNNGCVIYAFIQGDVKDQENVKVEGRSWLFSQAPDTF